MLNEIQLINTDWPYAKLTAYAKQNGGPEAMLEGIQHAGRMLGRMEMIPVVIGAAVVSGIVTALITTRIMKRRNEYKAEIETNKKGLIGA